MISDEVICNEDIPGKTAANLRRKMEINEIIYWGDRWAILRCPGPVQHYTKGAVVN